MYCKNCGEQIDDNSKFCSKCGSAFQDDTLNTSSCATINNKKWYQKKISQMDSSDKKKLGVIGTIIVVIFAIILIFIALDSSDGTSKKIEIIGTPTMTVEYNEYLGYAVSIKGQAKNNGGTTSYVSVTFNLYNSSGHIIGSVMDNHNTLGNGAIWNFNATVGYYGNEKPVRFELASITHF